MTLNIYIIVVRKSKRWGLEALNKYYTLVSESLE